MVGTNINTKDKGSWEGQSEYSQDAVERSPMGRRLGVPQYMIPQ